MLWVDYREKLGIGFTNIEKFKLLQSKIVNLLNTIENSIPYRNNSYLPFCLMVGIRYQESYNPIDNITEILSNCRRIEEFFSTYIGFVNTFVEIEYDEWGKRETFINMLINMMHEAKIGYEIQNDREKNEYFVFPQGAQELDNALVSATLEWLNDYPVSQKTFTIALRQYADGEYIRDVADNFRKSLEEFLKEFFGNSKNLANNIKEVGVYLKEQGGDSEIIKILVGLISCYDTLNNKVAKHNDKVDAKFLEFLMYQTGLFIRMLIVIKSEQKKVE
ncbi:MAG: hypothetical protein KID04_13615 [Clostridium sp.]|nr:hypothetical protein [Clostridium sp.]